MTTEPIRSKKQVQEIADYWLDQDNFRNYVLIVLGVCTALRISDLLRLKWDDVYDLSSGKYRPHIILTEKKTGKEKQIALNKQAIAALKKLFPHKKSEYVFASNREGGKAIGRVQAWRIVKKAAKAVKATGKIACHSLRKTFGYFSWKAGVLPALLMDIFNHSSYEITRRYLGISQDDRDKIYLNLTLFQP